jgi:zinc protease
MDDLKNMQVSDLRAWYQHWYAPNNATLVIVGDVDPDATHTLVKRYFGRIKPVSSAAQKPRREIPQRGIRRVTLKAPAELPYVILGYKTPVLKTAENKHDAYALEVIAGILDGGNSARLARDLIRGQKIAASASAGYDMLAAQDSLLVLDGTPASGASITDLENQLRQQIRQLRQQPVTAEELARVKAQVVAADVYERDSVFYQAMKIGILESTGQSWRLLEDYVDNIRAVTAEQVQQVARKYLNDDQLTVATLEPLPTDTARDAPISHSHGAAYVH